MERLQESKFWRRIDWWLLITVVILCIIGFVAIAVATASPLTGEEVSLSDKLGKLNLNLVKRQLMWFGVGIAALIFMMLLDYDSLKDLSIWIYGVNVLILLSLYVLATAVRSTVSWYTFGSVGFQPSEICKISLILVLAKVLTDHVDLRGIRTFTDVAKPLALTGIAFILVALQPDFGTAAVYMAIVLGMLFLARVNWKITFSLAGVAAVVAPLMWFFFFDDRQRNRILVMLNPGGDIANAGYNVHYSKIAIGSGGWTGNGLLSEGGLSQLNWIPVKESDFIFSVIAEATGFLGGFIIICLYAFLIYRILKIGFDSGSRFGTLICVGVASMLMFHIFENIGMTIGVMPVTGIPLPFISYGGSNMLTNMLAMGLVQSVKFHTRRSY